MKARDAELDRNCELYVIQKAMTLEWVTFMEPINEAYEGLKGHKKKISILFPGVSHEGGVMQCRKTGIQRIVIRAFTPRRKFSTNP